MQRWWNINNPYSYRNDNLKLIGFKSFAAYLKSPLWQSIRERVLLRYRMCQSCQKRASAQVHHRSYDIETLLGKTLNSLTALCAKCHKKGERPWLLQDRHNRLQHANHVALRGERRVPMELTEPIDAAPMWHRREKRQRKTPPFSTDMRPRLVKVE